MFRYNNIMQQPYCDGVVFHKASCKGTDKGTDPSLNSFVKRIAEKESQNMVSELGELIANKKFKNYTIDGHTIEFSVSETICDYMMLQAKRPTDETWTFITKFGGK
jgi:hypothetical protein